MTRHVPALLVASVLAFAGCGSSEMPTVPPPPKGPVAEPPKPNVAPPGSKGPTKGNTAL